MAESKPPDWPRAIFGITIAALVALIIVSLNNADSTTSTIGLSVVCATGLISLVLADRRGPSDQVTGRSRGFFPC